MTDRELLELAAKAAGINGIWNVGTNGYFEGIGIYDEHGYMGVIWNPLTDNGDALRLVVKLQLQILPMGKEILVTEYQNNDDGEDTYEPFGNDPYAATRRAIVRAAAEIGKGMK